MLLNANRPVKSAELRCNSREIWQVKKVQILTTNIAILRVSLKYHIVIYNELWVLWRFPPLRTDASFIVYEGSRLQDSPPLPRLPLRGSLLLNLSKDRKGETVK